MNSIRFHEKPLKDIDQWIKANDDEDVDVTSELHPATELSNTTSVMTLDKLPPKTANLNEVWKRNPYFFQRCMVSRLAATKMLSHAISGGDIEIMGMLVGYTSNDTIVVRDCYSLPVEGTETRVNAQMESYEYMVQYLNAFVAKEEAIVGWYHSHPGYECWLSNIDIQTQSLNQNYQDPYLAIVVDPKKSLKNKALDIGAFRTVPSQDKNVNDAYYPLNIQLYQHPLDSNISRMQFRFKVDSNIKYDPNEGALLKDLLDCVENWYHAKKLMKSSVPINPIDSNVVNRSVSGNEDFGGGRSNSVSTTSSLTTRHTTDVEMDEQESDQSSLGASVNPVPGVQFQEAEIQNEYELKKKKLLMLKVKQYHKLRIYKNLFTASE